MSEKDEILQNEEMMEETAEETVKSSEKKSEKRSKIKIIANIL